MQEKYGVDKIEVRDNGHGLIREDIEKICKGGYTSKLQDTRSLSKQLANLILIL